MGFFRGRGARNPSRDEFGDALRSRVDARDVGAGGWLIEQGTVTTGVVLADHGVDITVEDHDDVGQRLGRMPYTIWNDEPLDVQVDGDDPGGALAAALGPVLAPLQQVGVFSASVHGDGSTFALRVPPDQTPPERAATVVAALPRLASVQRALRSAYAAHRRPS